MDCNTKLLLLAHNETVFIIIKLAEKRMIDNTNNLDVKLQAEENEFLLDANNSVFNLFDTHYKFNKFTLLYIMKML